MTHLAVKRVGEGRTWVQISGPIDETFSPQSLVDAARNGVVVIDMDGVTRITSFGVRQWQSALRSLQADYYCFIRCRPSIVWQFNFIAKFGGRGELVSFYAPYVCDRCNAQHDRLIDLRYDYALIASGTPGNVRCPRCGRSMELDDSPDLLFEYARVSPPPTLPSAANELIDGTLDALRLRFRAEKSVARDLTALWLSGDLDNDRWFRRLADGLQGDIVVAAADVSSVSETGAAGLSDLLVTTGCRFFLARVPRPLWVLTRRVAARARSAALISVVLPFRCGRCARGARVPVNRSGLEKLGSGARLRCGGCNSTLTRDFDDALVVEAQQLPFNDPPRHVSEYLESRATTAQVVGDDNVRAAHPAVSILVDGYEVLQTLGAGGMGQVFLARKTGIGGFDKLVVLKVVHGRFAGDSEYVSMFLNEARLAARLSHPNIVQIFDIGVAQNQFFSVMEYVAGSDLGKLLRISRTMGRAWPIEICCTIASDICNALWAAHSHHDSSGEPLPILHRDVSPDNILLSHDGAVKLADFGIARVGDIHSTDQNKLMGKAPYMPPEVLFEGERFRDPRCDLYALGVVLYEMLHQSLPHQVEPRSLRPVLSVLEKIVEDALATERDRRIATARVFRDRLDEVLARHFGGRVGPAALGAFVGDLLKLAERSFDADDCAARTIPASPFIFDESTLEFSDTQNSPEQA